MIKLRNSIIQGLILGLLATSNVLATKKSVSQIVLQKKGGTSSFKIGDTEEKVIGCLGKPLGLSKSSNQRKTFLFYGGGKVKFNHKKVSAIILPNDNWFWEIMVSLDKNQPISDNSLMYKWELLVNQTTVAQGVWKNIKYIKHKHGDESFDQPRPAAPFIPYFMKYRDVILIVSSANGTKRFVLPFHNGVAQGHSRFWHPNGSLWMIGQYKNNAKSGLWIEWELNGDLFKWKYGKAITTGWQGFSAIHIWPDLQEQKQNEVKWNLKFADRTHKTGRWKKGDPIPFAIEIYESTNSVLTLSTLKGQELIQLTLKKGDLDGKCLWRNLDGTKKREGQFKNNRRIGAWNFYNKKNECITVDRNENEMFIRGSVENLNRWLGL
jgi:antitoxin component YwqK of YwqJK toxin-antitoxin module